MSKNKCINRSLKPFKDLKSNVSKALGLNDLLITDESLLDVIDMFAIDNNIDQDEVLDNIEELSKYIEDYFGFNTKYTPDSQVKELYEEWYTDNEQYINTPYNETKESLEFEEIVNVVTEGTAKTIKLSNGQKMTIIPNNDPVAYYNISPTSVEKTLKNNGLIHSYNDALFVTRKENKTTQQLKEDIYKELELYGYSRNSVTFKDKFNSILVEINEPQRKVDFVDAEVNKSMRSIRDVVEFLSEKIPAIKEKVHYNVTVEEATKVLKKAGKQYHDGINSFVHNGEIYLIQDKFTKDIAIEEVLHIFTESLIADNVALANSLLKESIALFPQLKEDIERSYINENVDTKNREMITQALSRIFRQEFNEGQRQEAESILKRFVNWVRQLFGLNPVTGNLIIELDQLSKDMTLRDLAQLINSSNAEFRTWSHNKTQFNKSFTSEQQKIIENLNPTSVEENKRLEDVEFVKKNYGEPLSYSFSKRDGMTVGVRVKFEKGEIEVVPAAGVISRIKGKEIKYPHDIKYFIGVNRIIEDLVKPYEQISIQPTPKAKGKMTFSYGKNKRDDITSTTTFEAIQNGERTATTRYESDGHIEYWKSLKEGDVIEWESKTGEKVLVRVTKPLTKLPKTTKAETWSKKEGWSTEYYKKEVKPRLDEAWQIEYELLDTKNIQTQQKPSKKKSLDDYVAEVEEMIDGFNRTVKKDKNFKKYHKYTITIDGKEKPVDISVTKLNEQVLGLEEFDDNDTVYPQGHIGNSFDALVRDYFDLSPEEFASKKYPNLNNKQVENLKKQLDQFKKQLDETFKDGYKVITKDWSLGGKVTIGKKEKLVAGSIDMMVVTNSGDIYIYDMKTTSKDIKDNLKKYRGQLTFYKELISATYSEIGKRIKGIGLLICDINFGNKYGNANYKAYSLEKNTDQLLFNGEKIQKQPGHINPVIQTTNDAQGGFIRNLDTLNKIEEIEKNPLDIVEIKTEEDLVAKELERRVKEEADKVVEKVDVEKLGTLKEVVNTDANLEPVSDVEIAYVSKAIMNILSAYIDLLNSNDSYRVRLLSNEDGSNDYAEGYFTSIPRDQILTSDVFHKLINYIKKNHFNYVKRKKEDVYPKLKWINKNFDAIVNAGFARLVTLERVSLTLTKDVTTENANSALAEAFEKAQREESQRMSYDIDAKEKSYMDSIPSRLKTKLNKIYKYEYDEQGNKRGIISDPFGFGIPEFEDGYYVVNTIMSLVHGCSKLSDMKKELLKHQSEYPFLGDVIETIFKDRQLKTQFYRTFRKNATLYNKLYRVIERDADGDISRIYYRSQPLSVGVKTDRILDNVNINMETNTPIVFDKVKNGVVKVNGEQVEKLEEALKPFIDLRRYRMSDVKEIRRILRRLGFDNIDNPSALANTKYTETTRQLVNNINNLLRLLKKKANLDKPFFYGSELGTSFYYIAKSLTVAMDDTYEISVYDGGKSRMTYTEPTELQTILEILGDKNHSMPFDRIIEEKYKKYAQFYDGKDFTSSWLTELSENPELRGVLNHHVRTTFEDTPYLKQNDKEYALSLILDYASPMISGNDYYKGKGDLALFRVPIMSDKNSAESILFKKYAVKYDKPEDGYGINEMKKEITDRAYSFFLQEVKRMKSVYQQLMNDPSGDIEFYHMRDPKARDKFVIKDANGKPKKLKKLTVKDFLELRSEKKFNGFTFSYCPWFNAEMDKSTKLAQYVVDIINGEKAPAGFKKLYEKVIKAGLEADYAKWKDHIENDLNISPITLAASITDITSIPSKKTEGQITSYDAFMQEYFWNDYLATCNIYHLTIIDPAFNKDTVDLQKRFSQVHSSTIKCDTEATFEDEDGVERNFSDGTFRFIILEDLTLPSEMGKDVEQIFLKAAEKAEKEGKFKEAKELKLLAKTIPAQYKEIDVSDGQAYSSPTGFWKKLNMLGEFDPEFDKYIMNLKDALDNISKGDFSIRNFNMVKQAFKPFLYGHSPHFEANTDMGEYLVPTQLKDSEAMIVLYGAIMQGADKHSPLTALFKFMENSHWVKDENGKRVYNDKGIDTIAFHSAVKVGAYGIVDINNLKSEKEVIKALENAVVHEIPYSAWGKQVENPEHFQDHTQGMGSQQRILTVSDIPDDAILIIDGKKYTKEEFLNKYFNNIAKDMRNGIDNVSKKLKLKGNRLERNKALSELLQKAVVKDAKYTDALRKAFTLNENGEFDIPLGDPTIADKFFSTLFSLVKKNVNLEEFQGGPVVQMSVFGMVDDLHMKYKYPDSKTGLYCEAYMTAPTKELEDRITVTKKNIKEVQAQFGNKYQIGEILETDDAIELGYMTEKEAWCIFDRIPTEDKYSIWPCRIKRFLSRQMGEFCILPKEITKFSGTDFDNDKGFITVRFKNEKSESNKLKNEIFEMQLTALLHSSTLEKSVHPGSFETLKDLAKDVDPNFGKNTISLMTVGGQYYYRHNNAAGKEYVGIAALNNICHAMSEMSQLGFRTMVDFKVNGISSEQMFDAKTGEYKYDTVTSIFDGTRISRTLGMFVGASADNAKDAVLASIGCTPTTATYVNGLLRMGIPLDVVVYMMSNPLIKEIVKEAEFSGDRLESMIAAYANTSIKENLNDDQSKVYSILSKTDFNAKSLLKAVKSENKEMNDKVLYFLYAMTPYVQAIADSNTYFALNSTKNSVGPDVYTTVEKELNIEDLFNKVKNEEIVLGESFLKVDEKLPFLKVLRECYTDLIPSICEPHAPIYQKEFRDIIKDLKRKGLYLNDENIKKVYNAYLVFRATKVGVLDGSYDGRMHTIFDTPITVFKDKLQTDNMFMTYLNVKNKMNKSNKIPTVIGKSTNLSTDTRNELSAHWNVLSKDKRTKELSDLVFGHFLYKFGFMFHPNSPLSMASSYVKTEYGSGNYGEIFDTKFNKKDFENFIIQYARNNPKTRLWYAYTPGKKLDEENITMLTENEIAVDITKINLDNVVGVNIYSDLYIKVGKPIGTRQKLKKVSTLGIENNFLEYNANENGVDMETINTDENKEKYGDALKELLVYTDPNAEATEEEDSPYADHPEVSTDDIFESQMMEDLLKIKEYKQFSSKVKAKEESVLNDIYQKLRRDKTNRNKAEFSQLLQVLNEKLVC